ncbi:MAG: transposase, partial [Lachnospiraceae bacterium]|nr:transposase [Lachnospiraceae bacterium]
KRSDRFVPVITIVVYYGEKAWDGAKSLYEMLKIPEEIVPYVNDYKMVLVEARRSGLKLHNSKNIDLFRLLEILLDQSHPTSETRKRAIEYAREKQVDRSVILAVAGAVNCKMDYTELTKEGADMCTVFEMTWAEGKAEGRVEGRAEGRVEGKAEGRAEGIAEGIRALILDNLEEGTSKERIILKLQKRFSLKEAEARKYMKEFAPS